MSLNERAVRALTVIARGIWRDAVIGDSIKPLDPENIHHRALIDLGADSFTRHWVRRDIVRVMLFHGDAWVSTHTMSIAEFTPDGFEALVARVTDLEDHVIALEERVRKQEQNDE